jgi:hypothetical protein
MMADDVTLLPCPMCGGTDIRIARLSASPDQSVWCHSCQLRTKWCYRDDAIAAWNTRVPDPRVAELEAELAKSRAWRATLADTGDELLVELRDAQRRIAELEAQLADARDCIDLFNRMIVRAECTWKAAHPDSAFYPDGADLIVWFKEQVDTLAGRRCETCRIRDERGWCEVNARSTPGNGFCSEWEAADAGMV